MQFADDDLEKKLLRLVAKGDEVAFSRLFSLYSNWVYATAFRLTESAALAEEIVQDVFLKIWLQRQKLSELDHFQNYLFIVAKNQSLTVLKSVIRRRKVLSSFSEAPSNPADNSTDTTVVFRDYHAALNAAIALLPHRQMEVYTLSTQQGFRRKEIAERLGISPHTVKIHLKEAMYFIRAYCRVHFDIPIILLFLIGRII